MFKRFVVGFLFLAPQFCSLEAAGQKPAYAAQVATFVASLNLMLNQARTYLHSPAMLKKLAQAKEDENELVVIVDVDKTALNDQAPLNQRCVFIEDEEKEEIAQLQYLKAMPLMVEFCNELDALGYEIFFVTSRPETIYESDRENVGFVYTDINLFNQGFRNYELLCMPFSRVMQMLEELDVCSKDITNKLKNCTDERTRMVLQQKMDLMHFAIRTEWAIKWKINAVYRINVHKQVVAMFDDHNETLTAVGKKNPGLQTFLMPEYPPAS